MRVKALLAAALAVLLSAAPLFAQDTGSVSGVVFDQGGAAVADASVRISGPQLPAGRTARTDQNGAYRFQLLLPRDAGADFSITMFEGGFEDGFGVRANQGGNKLKGRQLTFTLGAGGAHVSVRNFKGRTILRGK